MSVDFEPSLWLVIALPRNGRGTNGQTDDDPRTGLFHHVSPVRRIEFVGFHRLESSIVS